MCMEDVGPIMTLVDDDGEELDLEFLDFIQVGEEGFVVLGPLEQDEDEASDVAIFRVVVTDDDVVYETVDDDRVLDEVFERFKEANADEYDFV